MDRPRNGHTEWSKSKISMWYRLNEHTYKTEIESQIRKNIYGYQEQREGGQIGR